MYNLPGFKQLVELLYWILVTLDEFFAGLGLGPNWTWGLAIIGLTIIVRLVLFPLTWKQYSNAHALQALQPKMRELQRKYKDDRNKLQAETMKLYQEHRVNPFASCLPLLLQLPVFLALYAAISGNADYLDQTTVKEMADAGFLWIKSVAEGGGGLGRPDPTHILLVLYIVTQLVSTELMLQTQTDKAQKWLMRAMPIIFVFMLWNFPSALFIYWVTTNLWTIGQQLIIRKAMKPIVPLPADDQPKKRSRIVDALVHANEAGQKARAERSVATEKARQREAGLQGQTRPSSSRKASQSGGKAPAAGKTATAGKATTAGKEAATAKQTGAGKPGTRKPPPGKGKPKAAASRTTPASAKSASSADVGRSALEASPQPDSASTSKAPTQAGDTRPGQQPQVEPMSESKPTPAPLASEATGGETESGPTES
jgi:YidC/Oxa1 family membrane protein insertase